MNTLFSITNSSSLPVYAAKETPSAKESLGTGENLSDAKLDAAINKRISVIQSLHGTSDTSAPPLEMPKDTPRKEVGIALLKGAHHQQLLDIYMQNAGMTEESNGIYAPVFAKTPVEKALAHYQQQAEKLPVEVEHAPEALPIEV